MSFPYPEPTVGSGVDGCRQTAAMYRAEAETLDPHFDRRRIVDLLAAAAEWDAIADRLERDTEVAS